MSIELEHKQGLIAGDGSLPVKMAQYAKDNGFNVLVLDTAGRLQIDTEMMSELLIIDRVYQPHEKLLVIYKMS